MFDKKITSPEDTFAFFPKTENEVHEYAALVIEHTKKNLDALYAFDNNQRTFDNTARALDKISGDFSAVASALEVLEMVSPVDSIRDACHQEVIKLRMFAVDAFSSKPLYTAFEHYIDVNGKQEKLSAEEQYYLDETMRDFRRMGLNLPDEAYEEAKKVRKELSEFELTFDENINHDKSTITVKSFDDLIGCDEHFMQHLARDNEGNYIIGCDYPSYFEVMEHCKVEDTRKRLYCAFNNRAYPANIEVLNKIIAKRDELAKKLGFASYAAFDIDSEMAETPHRAEQFIRDLVGKARQKMEQELFAFMRELPEGVSLDSQGCIKPWDLPFIKNAYKEKHFKLNDHFIAEYFPVDRTLQGVFSIYQNFLNLEFKLTKPAWLWHEDVQLIEIREQDTKVLRGYVYLDLYPRNNKYSHACHCGIVHTVKMRNAVGQIETYPSVAMVIANFPKATEQRPALLKHSDVETFFHEFGHAMHFVLGSTELVSFAGTSVKRDFVEVPSQMFEEWMFDKQLLKGLSSHYKTGKQLPDEQIEALVGLKKFGSGYFVVRQCMLSLLALDLFKEGANKDSDMVWSSICKTVMPHVSLVPQVHMQASFGHLTGYGARYYGYMWAKVFALDLFYAIREKGLGSSVVGKTFAASVLAPGGSKDPNLLLQAYLGREPKQDAFLNDLGLMV